MTDAEALVVLRDENARLRATMKELGAAVGRIEDERRHLEARLQHVAHLLKAALTHAWEGL